MAFEALSELLDDSLRLPIGGRTYVVPAPSAAVGLRTQAIVQAAVAAAHGGSVDEEVLADAAERDLYRDVLGTAYDEMVDDGVTWPALKHSALTAMVWVVQDRAAAERYWNAGGDPKATAPNRASRWSPASRSAGAKSTQSRASTSGMSTRQAPRRGTAGGARRT